MTAKKAAKPAKPTKKVQSKPAAKPSAKPREPETKPLTDAERAAYEQGRRAQLSGIERRSAPHGKGALRDAWSAGWDFQKGVAF
ncbi:hypothetical protein [Sphingopyxis sp. 113P3]|uniref:hypothetical protein n=1 Tax=Sphingopyxis sp. (strain 113P3) TaxID=292913 RepID=UPI0006AD2610|nr:hypothetical protein [Sphingopyxis sp. 113P3]ALC11222.1 hypothetical protein LH20_04575 [Sphingopyxis sp. 113P3]